MEMVSHRMRDALYVRYFYFRGTKLNQFKCSEDGLKLIEEFEGCQLETYQDSVGIWTIGYGHIKGVCRGMTCTQAQAEEWLAQDVQIAAGAVNRLVTESITQREFDALVSFVFNLGQRSLANSTLLKLLNAGDHDGAADQFKRWDKAGGVEVAGLLRRRNAESALFMEA